MNALQEHATSVSSIKPPVRLQQVSWVRIGSVAAAALLVAALAPVIWLAVAAGVGLLALGVVLAIGVGAMQLLPLAGQKLENRLLAMRKAEARRNPIEQLQNELLRRADRLKAFRGALVTVGAQIESIAQMLAQRRHQDPEHVLEHQQRALARLRQFHALNIHRLRDAEAALAEFRSTIERKESEWRIALAIQDATAALDPDAAEGLMQELLADTALRAVQERFNAVFAELDVQMSSVDAPTRRMLEARTLERIDELSLPSLSGVPEQPTGRP